MVNLIIKTVLCIAICYAFASSNSTSSYQKALHTSYTYEYQQKYADALRAIQPLESEYSKDYLLQYRLSWLYYSSGKFADAIRYAHRALVLEKNSLDIHVLLLKINTAKADWKVVEQTAHTILKIDKSNSTAYYYLILALKHQKKYEEALVRCTRILQYYPTSADYLYEQAEIHYLLGEKRKAKKVFELVYTLSPSSTAAQNYLKLLIKE